MTFITSIYVPILIFSLGYSFVYIARRLHWWKGTLSDVIHASIVGGTFIIVMVGIIIGMRVGTNFSGIYYLLIAIGAFMTILLAREILKNVLSGFNPLGDLLNKQKTLLSLVCIFLGSIIILNAILPPLRGFDALWRYFPESLVFYQTNHIPVVDYLIYRPVTYEPVNTLLYTFGFYLINQPSIDLLPLLYLGALILLCYNIAELIFDDKKKSLYTVCILIVLPIFHWLIEFWLFYQELYVTYFFSLTIYYMLRYYRNKQRSTALFLFILSLSLTVLSKLNGWFIIPVLLLIIPSGKYGKFVKISIISIFWFLLSYQAATITSVWVFIPLLIYAVIMILSVVKAKKSPAKLQDIVIFGIGLSVGVLIGLQWILNVLNRLPVGIADTFGQYIRLGPNFIFSFPLISFGPDLILENMQGVDMFTTMFVLFLAEAFVGPWLILKFLGLKEGIHHDSLIIWLFFPIMVWLTNYGQSPSIRYIMPIMLPLALLTTIGAFKFWEILRKWNPNLPQSPTLPFLGLFLFLGILEFYPTIPLLFLLKFPITKPGMTIALEQSYFISGMAIFQILLAIVCTGVIIIIYHKNTGIYLLKVRENINTTFTYLNTNIVRILTIAIIIIIMIGYSAPYSLFVISEGGNIDQERALFDPYSTNEYKQVISYLLNENVLNATVLTTDIAGIGFYTNMPTLDIREDPTLFQPIFDNYNVTEGLGLLNNPLTYAHDHWGLSVTQTPPAVGYIIVPNYNHPWYPYYENGFQYSSYLFSLIHNNLLFNTVITNDMFIVYKTIFPIPYQFYGIINAYISNNISKISLLEPNNAVYNAGKNANLVITMYLGDSQQINMTKSLELTINTVDGVEAVNSTLQNVPATGYFSLTIPLSSIDISFSLGEIHLYNNINSTSVLKSTDIMAISPINITLNGGNWILSTNSGMLFKKA